MPVSETNSMYDVTRSSKDAGVILDACREVRIKLYMGQVTLDLFGGIDVLNLCRFSWDGFGSYLHFICHSRLQPLLHPPPSR